jgi:uncharacterized repeat protein (TIGR01451 family)
MNRTRLFMLLGVMLLSLALVGMALAADNTQQPPPDGGTGVTLTAPTTEGGQVNSLTGSFVAFDPSVGGDVCYIPGDTQTFCFRAESFSPDYEYVYNLWEKFPTDWIVNNVYVQGTPACDNGSWGTFSWSFQTSPYEVNIYHPRYQGSGGAHCIAYYCFDVTAGSGTPDAMESWYWDGDGYANPPHNPCSNDVYTPAGQNACDEAVLPQAAIPPCVLDPIMLTPIEQEYDGCGYAPQEHIVKVWNNAGYDTTVNLTYSIIAGAGNCTGPASIFLPNGTTTNIIVGLMPFGSPGDTVTCEIYAEDQANPNNFDLAWINKNLVPGFFDPAWQLEPIVNAITTQWQSCAVGTNPGAVGEVAYQVQGLAPGSVTQNILQMYDPDTATWTQLAAAPDALFSHVTGWIDGKLYVAGGYSAAFVGSADLEVYDPITNSWDNTTYTDLPAPRGGAAGGVAPCHTGAGLCLIVVGGGPDGQFVNTSRNTFEYDPGTNSWTQLDDRPLGDTADGVILGGGVACEGFIFQGGDYRGYNNFFRLDPTEPAGSQWTQLADIPGAAGKMTPAMVCKPDEDAIYLIGGDSLGYWGDLYNAKVFRYDIIGDAWSGPLPQTLNVGMLGSCGVNMANSLWTFAGTNGAGPIVPVPHESLGFQTCVLPPLIQVVAPPLHAVQPPDALTTMQMGICNVGGLPLDWALIEVPLVNNLSHEPTVAFPTKAMVNSIQSDSISSFEGVVTQASPGLQGSAGSSGLGNPEAVLWDNGPLVNFPAACSGMDASRLQGALGMTIYGFGHQFSVGNRMADDFEITDPYGWQIDQITFFAYQSNAPISPSPITGVYYQIWDGPPNDPGSSIIFGDLVTNRLLSSTTPNMQRDWDSGMCANNRYIFADVANAGLVLPPGIYWIDWMTDGSGAYSGPWAPPITINGQTTTGNGLQYLSSSGAWQPALDVGQQGLPFIVEGTVIAPPDIPWLNEIPASGTVLPGECTSPPVDINFDSTGMAPGDYFGDLLVVSNDPVEPVVDLPVALTVITATMEKLAPPEAFPGDTFSYIINVEPSTFFGTAVLTDVIPVGLEFANNLACTIGTCSYDAGANAVYWNYAAPPAGQPLVPAPAGAPRQVELTLGNIEAAGTASLAPAAPEGAVPLVLDDGSLENNIGLNDGTYDYQFLWFNRFTPAPADLPFNLNQIQVLFGASTGVNVGDDIDLVVYHDPDGDPMNGANWLATYNVTVQAVDGTTWSVYDLPAPLLIGGPGDVLIGVINRYTVSGVSLATFPGALDQTTTQQRSWVAAWNTDPPDPAILPADGLYGLIDVWFPGNWMIRGYGETLEVSISFDVHVTTTTPDLIVNTANLWWSGFVGTAQAATQILVPEITLAKTVGIDPTACATTDAITVTVGTDVTYCYTVYNSGNVLLTSHDLVDSELGPIFTGLLYDLAPGAGVYVTETATIMTDTVNTGTWTAWAADHIHFAVATSNPATVTMARADLAVTKTGPDTARVGELITYTINVANLGPVDATNVVIVDTLPAGATFVSAPAFCTNAAGVVTCNVPLIPVGGNSNFEIVITMGATGPALNSVTATADQLDPDASNNTATWETDVVPANFYFYLPIINKDH